MKSSNPNIRVITPKNEGNVGSYGSYIRIITNPIENLVGGTWANREGSMVQWRCAFEAVDIGSSVTLDFYATHAESRKRQVTKGEASFSRYSFFLTGKVYDIYIYIIYICMYIYISLHMYSAVYIYINMLYKTIKWYVGSPDLKTNSSRPGTDSFLKAE